MLPVVCRQMLNHVWTSYVGARIQHRLPESVIRRALGGIVVIVGAIFLADGRT